MSCGSRCLLDIMEIGYFGEVTVVGDRYSASFSDLPGCYPEAASLVELEAVAARAVEDHVRDHFRQFQRLPTRYCTSDPTINSGRHLCVFVDLDYLLW